MLARRRPRVRISAMPRLRRITKCGNVVAVIANFRLDNDFNYPDQWLFGLALLHRFPIFNSTFGIVGDRDRRSGTLSVNLGPYWPPHQCGGRDRRLGL